MADGTRGGEAHPLKDLAFVVTGMEAKKKAFPDSVRHDSGVHHKVEVDVDSDPQTRETSLDWLKWMQEREQLILDNQKQGFAPVEPQKWQSYASRLPKAGQMLLTLAEQRQWDKGVQAFFLANPVLRLAQHQVDHLREMRMQPNALGYIHQTLQQLMGVLPQLEKIERCTYKGSIPGAEAEVIRLKRLLLQELNSQEKMVDPKNVDSRKDVVAQKQDVVWKDRNERRDLEEGMIKRQKEYEVSKQRLMQQGSRLRDALLAAGVEAANVVKTMGDVSRGDFTVLKSMGSWKSRLVDGWRAGGLFRALKDAVRPDTSVLMEQAQGFYRASADNLVLQQAVNEDLRANQRLLVTAL